MQFAEGDPVLQDVRAVRRMPPDEGGVDAGRLSVQHSVKTAHRAAIAEILQDIDRELLIAAVTARDHQTVEPQFFADIGVQRLGPPFVQDGIDDSRPCDVRIAKQAENGRVECTVGRRVHQIGDQHGMPVVVRFLGMKSPERRTAQVAERLFGSRTAPGWTTTERSDQRVEFAPNLRHPNLASVKTVRAHRRTKKWHRQRRKRGLRSRNPLPDVAKRTA